MHYALKVLTYTNNEGRFTVTRAGIRLVIIVPTGRNVPGVLDGRSQRRPYQRHSGLLRTRGSYIRAVREGHRPLLLSCNLLTLYVSKWHLSPTFYRIVQCFRLLQTSPKAGVRFQHSVSRSRVFEAAMDNEYDQLYPDSGRSVVKLFSSLGGVFTRRRRRRKTDVNRPLALASAGTILTFVILRRRLTSVHGITRTIGRLRSRVPRCVAFNVSRCCDRPGHIHFRSRNNGFVSTSTVTATFTRAAMLRSRYRVRRLVNSVRSGHRRHSPTGAPTMPVSRLIHIAGRELTANGSRRQDHT